MNTETEKEEPTVLRKPLRHLEYDILVFFCVGINFALMIVSYMIFGPKSFDTTKVLWFHVSILAFVPTLGTFFICLLVSTKTQHILVSPVYVTFFTAIPALILGVYVQYAMNYSLLEVERMNSVFAYLLVGVFAYFIWFYLSGSLSQPIIRNLVGAYAERGNVKSGTTIYQTSDVERILEKMEDKKWLSDLCSLRIVERKEDKNEIRLKLNKHNTDFFLSVYGRKLESESYVALTHYELFENLVEKTIMVNDDSRVCLRPQIVELEESLELKPVSVKKARFFTMH